MHAAIYDPLADITPSQIEARKRSEKFKAEIAARAGAIVSRLEQNMQTTTALTEPVCSAVVIDITEPPETDTSVSVVPCECQTVFVGGSDAIDIDGVINPIARITVDHIQRIVAKVYGVSRIDLLSARRLAKIVRPRQVAMFLARELTARSLPDIGRRFGGRDHTTVLHAYKKIGSLVGTDVDLSARVDLLKAMVKAEVAS